MTTRTIWHIVDPDTMLIMGRRFSRKSATNYVTAFNKATGRNLKVLRSEDSLRLGYKNASSTW